MGRDFLPRADGALDAWTRRFADALVASPEAYRVPIDAALAYAALQARWAEAYGRTTNPNTRSAVDVTAKDDVRAELVAETRRLARLVRAEGVSNELLTRIDLPVPRARRRRVRPPAERPRLGVTAQADGSLQVRIRGDSFDAKARPSNAVGAMLLWHVGPEQPATTDGWTFAGLTTERTATLRPDWPTIAASGGSLLITAAWLSPRLELGPLAIPYHQRLGYGPAGNGNVVPTTETPARSPLLRAA